MRVLILQPYQYHNPEFIGQMIINKPLPDGKLVEDIIEEEWAKFQKTQPDTDCKFLNWLNKHYGWENDLTENTTVVFV